MRVRIRIHAGPVDVDEVISGKDEAELAKRFRKEVEKRAPLAARLAMKALSDHAFWEQVVKLHNKKAATPEPFPRSAGELLAFGERAGYVTRLTE
ncbi:MAG: hypothetical protein ACOZIN_21275 [Myxococcota bacterium]